MNELDIFNAALEIPAGEQRRAYVDEACRADAQLRRRVEDLLRSHDEAGSFMNGPAPDIAATAEMRPIAERPGMTIGPYKLMEQVGEGGMGVVYVAEQREPVRRKVALKIIKPGMDSKDVIARFEAERQALALMDHPNIAKVLDAGATESGRPYFVMELVRGITITEYCDQHNLSTRERLELFVTVCHAIKHAHQKGVIHRDVKPSNVMVTLHDGKPIPKIIDFGVAKAINQRLTERTVYTQYAQMVGTPLYMSPEQAEMSGLDVDTRTDIYSLGVLLYELLTGTTPFDRKRFHQAAYDEVRRIIREEDPPKPSTRISTLGETGTSISAHRKTDLKRLGQLVRGDIDWIVMKSLEKDRTRRYETANDLAADILRHINHEPILAGPPSATYKLRKFARRNRAAMATIGLVATALIFGTVMSTWQAIRATKAEKQTQAHARELAKAHEKETQLRAAAEADRDRAVEAERAAVEARKAVAEQRDRAEAQRDENRRLLYTSDLATALRVWEDGLVPEMGNLIQRYRPAPGEKDLRGFEWHYLRRLYRKYAAAPTLPHDGMVLAMAYSPDGRSLATADVLGNVTVWDADTCERRFQHVAGGAGTIQSVAFSPDGETLAVKCVRHSLVTRRAIDFVSLLDSSNGEVREAFESGALRQLQFSPDGKNLAIATSTEVKLRKMADGVFGQTLKSGDVGPTRIAFSPDGALLASAEHTGAVRIWDLVSGDNHVLDEGPYRVVSLAFSPNGRVLACGTEEGSVRLWNPITRTQQIAMVVSRTPVQGIAFSPDGKMLATASPMLDLWDVEAGRLLGAIRGAGIVMAFAPDGKTIAAGSPDDTVRIVRAVPDEAGTVLSGHTTAVMSVAASPDGELIASSSLDQQLILWDTITGRERMTLRRDGAPNTALCFSSDGESLLSLAATGYVLLWDVATGARLQKFDLPATSAAAYSTSLALSHDDMTMARGDAGGGVVLCDVRSGEFRQPIATRSGSVVGLAFSPDGQTLAAAIERKKVELLSVATGECHHELADGIEPSGQIAFSPDGQRVACGCFGGQVCVWDAATGELLATMDGHAAKVTGMAFSADGTSLFTTAFDGTLRIWGMDSYEQRAKFNVGTDAMLSLAASENGEVLAIGGTKGDIHLWRAALDESADELDERLQMEAAIRDLPDVEASGQSEILRQLQAYLSKRSTVAPRDLALAESAACTLSESGNHQLAAVACSSCAQLIERSADPEWQNRAKKWLGQSWEEQGRFHADQDRWKDAADCFTKATEFGQETPQLWHERAIAYATMGGWSEAAADWRRVVQPISNDAYPWCALASLQLLAGDKEGYKATCREAFQRLSGGHKWLQARLVHLCSLAPECGIDAAELTRLAESALRQEDNDTMHLARGMADYRAGRFEDAISHLPEGGDAWKGPAGCFIRAMSYHALGDERRARQELVLGIETLQQTCPTINGPPLVDYLPERWIVWCFNEVIRREAQATVLGTDFEHLRQAYDSLAAGELAEAVKALDKGIERQPDDSALRVLRGTICARLGHWSEAAAAFRIACQLNGTDAVIWARTAPLLILSDDEETYAQHCEEMLAQFATSKNIADVDKTCKACLLLPGVAHTTDLPMETFNAALDDGSAPVWFLGWGFVTRALADYRTGNAAAALRSCRASQETKAYTESPALRALVLVVSAMVQDRLGQFDEAQQSLSQASKLIDENLPKLRNGELGGSWSDWLIADILRREASALNDRSNQSTVSQSNAGVN